MHNIRELQLMLMNCSRARYRAFHNNVKEPFHFRTAYNLAPESKMNCACRGEKIVSGGKFVWDMCWNRMDNWRVNDARGS